MPNKKIKKKNNATIANEYTTFFISVYDESELSEPLRWPCFLTREGKCEQATATVRVPILYIPWL